MAEESKAGGLNPIPPALADDHEDVSWALSTAKSTWDRGEHMDALKWLRRAVEAASEAEADDRALTLAKAAADLTTRIDELGWDLGSVRPPPGLAGQQVDVGPARPTVRLSAIVVPAAPPAPTSRDSRTEPRPSVPIATPAPSRATPAAGPTAPNRVSQGAPISVPRPAQTTGSSLLGNAAGNAARPKHPSLGLLGPRPKSDSAADLPVRPPLPTRASRPPTPSRPSNASRPPTPPPTPTRAPTPPPPPASRVEAPAVIEAISSKNLVSAGMPSASPEASISPAPPVESRLRQSRRPPPSAEAELISVPSPDTADTVIATDLVPAELLSPASPEASLLSAPPPAGSDPQAASLDAGRTTKPAGPWDDGSDDGTFAPTPVYPSGPESITFVAPHLSSASSASSGPRGRGEVLRSGVAAVARAESFDADEGESASAMRALSSSSASEGEPAFDATAHPTTAPPASSSAIENILRNTNFASSEDMESWPTENVPGNDLPNFAFDDATKTRIGTPIYREEALSRAPAGPEPYDATRRIAARGPAQKPSQAVRVVVWRGPDGVHIAPHGTTVTAISVDALLVALDPSADLFAWLTNK